MNKKIIDDMIAEINAFRKKHNRPPMTEEGQKAFVEKATGGGKEYSKKRRYA